MSLAAVIAVALATAGARAAADAAGGLHEIPGVPDLSAGVGHVTSARGGASIYVLRYQTVGMTLAPATEPGAYLADCKREGRADSDCAFRALLWGWAQVKTTELLEPESVVRPRGWRFAVAGYRALTASLAADVTLNDSTVNEELNPHQIFIPVSLLAGAESEPQEFHQARLDYGLAFWATLPRRPADLKSFTVVGVTTEMLKAWISHLMVDRSTLPLSSAQGQAILAFWEASVKFHQQPYPAVPKGARWEPSSLSDGISLQGIGYATWPGMTDLAPLRVLATTDLVQAGLTVRRLLEWRLIEPDRARWMTEEFERQDMGLREAEMLASLARAEQAHDKARAVTMRRRLAIFYRDQKRMADAERALRDTLDDEKALGQMHELTGVLVDLASYRLAAKDWSAADDLYDHARRAMKQGFGLERYEELRRGQALSLAQLHRPDVADAALSAAAKTQAELADRLFDIRKMVDPKARMAALVKLREHAGSAFIRVAIDVDEFRMLWDERRLDEAADALVAHRSEVSAQWGLVQEAVWVGNLLAVRRLQGNYGKFDEAAADFQRAATRVAGSNWRGEQARTLAEVAYALQDYETAAEHLRWWLDRQWTDLLESGLVDPSGLDRLGNDPQDTLLLARIELARGHREAADELQDAVAGNAEMPPDETNLKRFDTSLALAVDLAEMEIASGRNASALARLAKVIERTGGPLNRPWLWTRAALMQANAGLRSGANVQSLADRFEAMAPSMGQLGDRGVQAGIEMDMFLAAYEASRNQHARGMAHARDALRAARASGSIDQQIDAHRVTGELLLAGGDLPAAIGEFRESAKLLKRISREIPGDIGKVGYRAERSKVFPLLVSSLNRLHQRDGDKAILDQVVEAAEQGKSQALSEMLFDRKGVEVPFSVAALRASLPVDTAIVAYYLPGSDEGRISRAIIDARSVRFDELATTARQLEERVRALRESLTRPHMFDPQRYRAEAAAFAAEILPGDWRRFVDIPYKQLFIMPTGPLHLLPFGALVDDQGRFLDQAEPQLAYLPNLSMLALPAASRPKAARAKAYVNPALDPDHHELLVASPDLRSRFAAAFTRWSQGEVRWELRWTPDEFANEAAGLDNVFLFAHARFLPGEPLNSYVRLAASPADGASRLTARDIMRSRVGNGLWVLAACSTGESQVRAGDEALGLPRALLEAGARNALISLWDVDADSSLTLMTQFYEALAHGDSIANALKTATSAMRQQGVPPYDWAPFVIIGHHDFASP